MCSFVVFAQAALAQSGATAENLKEATERALQVPIQRTVPTPDARVATPTRPALLAPMYGTFIALQGLDIHSTLTAIDSGHGREVNPLLSGLSHNAPCLIAVKAASTAGVIWATEKLWKRHRVAAVVLMASVNSAMTFVVARNYRHAS